ncbi:MarP family serine protease [Kineococcus rhizosphaerae]|uniref:Colicin V production protein n=1 Tax=Kineococcus rhizosphaerae TaxID=559628 RepID=A0A2T0R5U6_9ACTN|nr:MarP family serine protease [Kineococcus rhizosphaerae]PRY16146.1 colicin V production protein [Kineococcus rhizosphaerae]
MSASDVLDVVLLVLLLAQVVAGYREGLLVGAAGFVGLVGGAAVGVVALPRVVAGWDSGLQRTLAVVVGTVVLAVLGRVLLSLVAARVRAVVRWAPARFLDALLGAVAGGVATLLVVWVVAGAARQAPLPRIAQTVTGSRVVTAVDDVVPASTGDLLSRFWSAAQASGFPRVFTGLTPEPIAPVAQPPANAPEALQRPLASVVKVTGVADSCRRGLEGSGFVVADSGGSARVVTNAHVVAGVERPEVQPGGQGRRYAATVVAFDADRDLAVLDVPGLSAPVLPRAPELVAGDAAVVVGFPLDGDYQAVPARVRQLLRAQGRDIHDTRDVVREVYSVAATVQPGNSGGPLLTEDGRVAGVVFAKSLDDPDTGYVLAPVELDAVLAEAGSSTAPVGTGACTA